MFSSLPPLGSLRAFIAVARHLSFSKAAAELHVTPAAVTHQIHSLERDLGTSLFRRNRRFVELTPAAEACLPELIETLEKLSLVVSDARARTNREVLNVSVSPAFASKLLLPRLTDFYERHPEIDIRVSATAQLVNLGDGHTDLAIRFGAGKYNGTFVEKLLPESVAPMCAPRLASTGHKLDTADALRHHRLIHDLSVATPEVQPDWRSWFVKAGTKGVDTERGLRFTLADLALQAAINGFGVVLGRKTLARDDLASGRLVQILDLEMPVLFSYFVVIPTGKLKNPSVGHFRDWLMRMASMEEAAIGVHSVGRKTKRQARLPK